MKKLTGLVMILAVMIVISGCETVKGVGQDISNTGDNIKDAASDI